VTLRVVALAFAAYAGDLSMAYIVGIPSVRTVF
jgi:hypothetical protein